MNYSIRLFYLVSLPLPLLAGALPLCVSPYCPPVCMPAAGCQPIRPPGQLLQPLALLQRHQHRQRSPRGHQLLPLQRDLRPQGGLYDDAVPVRGHLPRHRAGAGDRDATCWGAAAIAAGYYFPYRWVSGVNCYFNMYLCFTVYSAKEWTTQTASSVLSHGTRTHCAQVHTMWSCFHFRLNFKTKNKLTAFRETQLGMPSICEIDPDLLISLFVSHQFDQL